MDLVITCQFVVLKRKENAKSPRTLVRGIGLGLLSIMTLSYLLVVLNNLIGVVFMELGTSKFVGKSYLNKFIYIVNIMLLFILLMYIKINPFGTQIQF